MKILISLLSLALLSCGKPTVSLQHYRALAASPDTLPQSWLCSETTIIAAEDENSSIWEGHKLQPFDDTNKEKWAIFKSKFQAGAKVYKWRSPFVNGHGLSCYARGYCLSLNDRIIAVFELIPICAQGK